MAQWSATFSGSSGGSYRLYVDVQVLGQEPSNNRTLIRYNCWIDKTAGSGFWNNTATYGNTNINGYNPGRSWASYDFRAYSRKYIAQNEDYWINHDANGDANPYFGANWNLNNGSSLGSASTGGNEWMPHINRYLSWVTTMNTMVTDVGWRALLEVNAMADNLAVSIDGGGWVYYGGSWTSRYLDLGGNLTSGVTHTVKYSARRADSGLWTETGTFNVTLNPQNNFFLMDAGSGF